MSLEKKAILVVDGLGDRLAEILSKEDAYLIVTADHSTPLSIRRHSSDPVPVLIYGNGTRRDKVQSFDEVSVALGCLGHFTGIELNRTIVDLMGCGHMVSS